MKSLVLLLTTMALSSCGNPLGLPEHRSGPGEDTITLTFGLGGSIKGKHLAFKELKRQGKKVIIDGQMISADAFYAFSYPGACYTENAVFSPHAAAFMGIIPRPSLTERLADRLPAGLRDWFKSDPAYHNWIGYSSLGYDQLLKLWPEGACEQSKEA